jgi:hypothetical protein
MRNFWKILFLSMYVAVASFSFSHTVYAQTSVPTADPGFHLVICGTSTTPPCNICDLYKVIKILIDFAFMRLLPILFMIMMVYVGILYLTAGAIPSNIAKANGMFYNLLIGTAIVLASWMIVNTILKVLAANTDYSTTWYQIECHSTKVDTGTTTTQTNGGSTTGGGTNPTPPPTDTANSTDKWCTAKGGSGTHAVPVKSDNSNLQILSTYAPAKGVIDGYQCQNSPFGAGKCGVSTDVAPKIVDLAKKFKDLCIAQSSKCTLQVTSALRTSAAKDPCHHTNNSQSGTCTDVVISCSGINTVACLNILKQAIGGSQAYDALNEYTVSSCSSQPSTRDGNNVHINF